MPNIKHVLFSGFAHAADPYMGKCDTVDIFEVLFEEHVFFLKSHFASRAASILTPRDGSIRRILIPPTQLGNKGVPPPPCADAVDPFA